MYIIMLTNTFTPHAGGVARSVETFAAEYRNCGHKVLVVGPEFENQPSNEIDVVRLPAIQNFNGSDFSVALPISGLLKDILETFQPDIVHSPPLSTGYDGTAYRALSSVTRSIHSSHDV